eukprot:gene5784-11685_t
MAIFKNINFIAIVVVLILNNCYGSLIRVKSVIDWPSSSGSKPIYAADGNLSTTWVTFPCLAGAWRVNPTFNLFYNLCGSGGCSGSCSAKLAKATDGSPYTAGSAVMSHGEGRSWAIFPFPKGEQKLSSIYVRGMWPVNTTLSGITATGFHYTIATLNPQLNYLDLTYPAPPFPLVSLQLSSVSNDGIMRGYCYAGVGDCKTIVITEIAAQIQNCFERLTVDIGQMKLIQYMKIDFSGATDGIISTSLDNMNYKNISSLKKYANINGFRTIPLYNVTARYIQLTFVPNPSNVWNKVYIKDIYLYGPSIPTSCPNKCSGRGVCSGLYKCDCTGTSYTGEDCSIQTCTSKCINGACIYGKCQCNSTYTGSACDIPICPNSCWGQGLCKYGSCHCYDGYGGADCRYEIFRTINNHKNISSYVLNYHKIIGNTNTTSAVKPPARTSFYKSQESNGRRCDSFKLPYRCDDGSCAVSLGACALSRLQTTNTVPSQWQSLNYVIPSLVASRVLSSSSATTTKYVVDGSETSFWQSGICYPTGYVQYVDLNVLYGACSSGQCISSGIATGTVLTQATDGDSSTGITIPLSAGVAQFQVNLRHPSKIVAITCYLSVSAVVTIYGIPVTGPRIQIGTAGNGLTDQLISSNVLFTAVLLEYTSSSFSVFEVAARTGPCWEHVTVDLGTPQLISALRIRHYAGTTSVVETRYEVSVNGSVWTAVRGGLPGNLISAVETELYPPMLCQYIRVKHILQESVGVKVFVWEVAAWDTKGKYGAPLPVALNKVNFRDLLGVNGIWAWGGQGWSMLAHEGWGPRRYTSVASHARNYHNWNWDVKDPDTIPNFEGMSCGNGTETQWWLSWDWEYSGWNAAGLEVQASIQFTASMFAQSTFNDPYYAAYNYGYAFARHFGSTYGTGQVATIEVGNEPWDYKDPSFYSQVLSGMSRGVKAADPLMRVVPASFSGANATLSRIKQSHLAYLDGLNYHAYSWTQTELGRSGVHPEHNMSTLHEVNWLLRFRNDNAPGLPVYLTEWGWDSAGGGLTCGPPAGREGAKDFPECVTEQAQALYAVRGALVLARKGLSRLTWYFYANTEESLSSWDKAAGLFARSGLTGPSSSGFQEKLSYFALEQFVTTLGDLHFIDVVREDRDAYVYLLGDSNGTVSHVVAWRPVDVTQSTIELDITFSCSYFPQLAWKLGFRNYTEISTLPYITGNVWTMAISGYPTVVSVNTTRLKQCNPSCSKHGDCYDGTCICKPGYTGSICTSKQCDHSCWQRGTCNADGSCSCYSYYSTGGTGEYQRCGSENLLFSGPCRDSPTLFDKTSSCFLVQCKDNCNNNGQCTSSGCVCDIGYSGETCAMLPCPHNCRSHGTCKNGSCFCSPGFMGDSCEWNDLYNQRTVEMSSVNSCHKDLPYRCDDGSCAVSLGACALSRQQTTNTVPSQWQSSNYVIPSLVASRVLSSSSATTTKYVVDGSETSFWQSGICYPTGYVQYVDLNVLYGACSSGQCISSGIATGTVLTQATDGDSSTGITIPLSAGVAQFQVNLRHPSKIVAITCYLSVSAVVTIYGIPVTGPRIQIGTAGNGLTDQLISSNVLFTAVLLEYTSSSFSVFEVAARTGPCWEHVTVDLGTPQLISALRIRHYAGTTSVVETRYEVSVNGSVWTAVRGGLPGNLISAVETELYPPMLCQYIRVKHILQESVGVKVFVWEVAAWDTKGKYGAPLPVALNKVNFRDLLGVNGIWAWGGQGWSMLAHEGWGPRRYTSVASHARNYHNWNWDVKDPDTIPNFEGMSCGNGTETQWWLSWDWEYSGWNAAGLEVQASIQFTASMFAQSTFNDPYYAAYNYGYAFARHFGSTYGTGQVATIEVGNEPWDYKDPSFYSQVLSGMSRGVKAADPLMRVVPASFSGANATLSRIKQSHLAYLDGLNYHAYSWTQTELGRSGVHPEHNMSTLHEVNWLLRFRNDNAPGLPVYLTEWGWDSAGGGLTCGPPAGREGAKDFPECVTEQAQALYAVRGALVLARKGLSRLTWYFYANTEESLSSWDKAAGLFARSGLTGPSSSGFQEKLSYFALEQFVTTLGDLHFIDVVREDRDAYVYLLGDSNATVSHVVAWRPVSANDTNTEEQQWSCTYIPLEVMVLPVFKASYAVITKSSLTLPLTLPVLTETVSDSIWTMTLTSIPVIITVKAKSFASGGITSAPTKKPSKSPTAMPSTNLPTSKPTTSPSVRPTFKPTVTPSSLPSRMPSQLPTVKLTRMPTAKPSSTPSTMAPTKEPRMSPTTKPTQLPSMKPTRKPTASPSVVPSKRPSSTPTRKPTASPSVVPSKRPSSIPTRKPSVIPSTKPSRKPSIEPSKRTVKPTASPTSKPIVLH